MTGKELIGLWILANLAAVGLYDLFALSWWGPDETVSAVVRQWAKSNPEILLVVGYLVCHLFGRGA